MVRAMATCSLSFSGQGQIQENISFPGMSMPPLWWVSNYWRTILIPDTPSPTITTLLTQRFWVTDYRGREVHLSPNTTRTLPLKTLSMALFCPDGSLQSTRGYHTNFTYSFSKMPGSFWSTLDVSYCNWTNYGLFQLSKPKSLTSGFINIQTEKWQVCAPWAVCHHLHENYSYCHNVWQN